MQMEHLHSPVVPQNLLHAVARHLHKPAHRNRAHAQIRVKRPYGISISSWAGAVRSPTPMQRPGPHPSLA